MENVLLPLDLQERVVCWKNTEGQIRRHAFRRLNQQDWEGYFSRIVAESDRDSRTIDINSAAFWLYAHSAQWADGYQVKGGAELRSLPHWQDRLPAGHRLRAISLLREVKASGSGDVIEAECQTVSLACLWDGNADGSMNAFSGLLHRFANPTADHQMRYSRETSRTLVIGGSRDGRTRYAGSQKILVKLYDELIQAVEGYSLNGVPLEGEANIRQHMDAAHKIAAVGVLFNQAAEEEEATTSVGIVGE